MPVFLLLLLPICLLLAACNNQPTLPNISPTTESPTLPLSFTAIELIDTFCNTLVPDTASRMTRTSFYPMYIGPMKSSIFLLYWLEHQQPYLEEILYKELEMVTGEYLEVFVDTTRIIGSMNLSISFHQSPKDGIWRKNYQRGSIKSYPVFIKNSTTDSLIISSGKYLPLLLEAKDSTGHWQPIQVAAGHFCGTCLTYHYFLPDEVVLTTCPQFAGKYATTLRLAVGHGKRTYSNEFQGRIDYRQFGPEKDAPY